MLMFKMNSTSILTYHNLQDFQKSFFLIQQDNLNIMDKPSLYYTPFTK